MNKEIFKKIEEIEDSCYLSSTCVLVQELKRLLNPEEQEKPKFVKGMVVKKKNVYEDKYKYLMYSKNIERAESLDWKTLARTIAYFIPNAVKALLLENSLIELVDKNGLTCENAYIEPIYIPYPNPSGKLQEINIERG